MWGIKRHGAILLGIAMMVMPAAASGQDGVRIMTFQNQTQPQSQASDTGDFVANIALRSKLFELKYRAPSTLVSILKGLGSGVRGALITPNDEQKLLAVRDYPENIATIGEAIKRLDVPESAPVNLELKIHALAATNGDPSSAAPLPGDLTDVVKELKNTLTFKNYFLLATVVQRIGDTSRPIGGRGNLGSVFRSTTTYPVVDNYEFRIDSIAQISPPSGPLSISLQGFRFFLTQGDRIDTSIYTDLTVRDGEKVVVGTAAIQDKALIIVVSVKTIK